MPKRVGVQHTKADSILEIRIILCDYQGTVVTHSFCIVNDVYYPPNLTPLDEIVLVVLDIQLVCIALKMSKAPCIVSKAT
jgi:hypothetical protein